MKSATTTCRFLGKIGNDQLGPALLSLAFYCIMEKYSVAHSDNTNLMSMIFSAFFSGMEIAFVTSNRMLAEMDKDKNGLSQKIQALFYKNPNNF